MHDPNEDGCSECSYKRKFKHNLKRHQIIYLESQQRTALQLNHQQLGQHAPQYQLSTVQRIIIKHICDQCVKGFRAKYGITLNKKNKHDNVFEFMCQICQKGFNQAIQYGFHLANQINVSFEKCSFRRKEFRSPGCLKKHLLVCKDNPDHVHVGKLVCLVCSASFLAKQSLTFLRQGKHQPPKCKCKECPKACAWRSSIRAHIKFAHN